MKTFFFIDDFRCLNEMGDESMRIDVPDFISKLFMMSIEKSRDILSIYKASF